MAAYSELKNRFAQISAIEGAASMLSWDAETFMPKGSAEVRGEQLSALASVAHEKYTAPDLGDLIAQAKEENLEGWDAANIKEMERIYLHANAVPQRFGSCAQQGAVRNHARLATCTAPKMILIALPQSLNRCLA